MIEQSLRGRTHTLEMFRKREIMRSNGRSIALPASKMRKPREA